MVYTDTESNEWTLMVGYEIQNTKGGAILQYELAVSGIQLWPVLQLFCAGFGRTGWVPDVLEDFLRDSTVEGSMHYHSEYGFEGDVTFRYDNGPLDPIELSIWLNYTSKQCIFLLFSHFLI